MTDEIAKQQVNAFIAELYERYNLSETDVRRLLDTVVRIQERTAFARRMGEWTAKSIIVVLVGAFFSALGWGLIHFIETMAKR